LKICSSTNNSPKSLAMALTETIQIDLESVAPDFNLVDAVTGNIMTLATIQGANGTVFMFICNHCPYVVHVREKLVEIANKYLSRGIGFVAISSNDVLHYPADGPELMKNLAQKFNFPFPYLYDESQDVAKA
jgi:peroxiredoxin